ncbi:uncharacterized protein LOC103509977 isoform X2 [Diaphorina citri]|uniref:Uncharacterized protein LOC103509977 isoform X2 n=1 Tax=Diaphorina citri TaxID=121845 RepID=A0A1S3D3S6_DIACI|nr:uncharacterized protein LOC103509977 isoform X2 [Diaphorina citri]
MVKFCTSSALGDIKSKGSMVKSDSSISWPFPNSKTNLQLDHCRMRKRNKSEASKQTKKNNVETSFRDFGGNLIISNKLKSRKMENFLLDIVNSISDSSILKNKVDKNISVQESNDYDLEYLKSKSQNDFVQRKNLADMRTHNLSDIKENFEQYGFAAGIIRKVSNSDERDFQNFIKTKDTKNDTVKESKKSKLKKGKQKPIISFFEDCFMNEYEIEKTNIELQRFARLNHNCNEYRDEHFNNIKKERNKNSKYTNKQTETKRSAIMSKFTHYKHLVKRLEHERKESSSHTIKNESVNISKENSTEESITVKACCENNFPISQSKQPQAHLVKTMADTKSSFPFIDSERKDICLEAYWNRTNMNFKLISKIFSILPPSKKVFDEFLRTTKSKKSSTTKVKKEYESFPVNTTLSDMKTENNTSENSNFMKTDDENKRSIIEMFTGDNLDLAQLTAVQSPIGDTSPEDFCPENFKFIKLGFLKEIGRRNTKINIHDEKFLRYFDQVVQEHASRIIKDIINNYPSNEDMMHASDHENPIKDISEFTIERGDINNEQQWKIDGITKLSREELEENLSKEYDENYSISKQTSMPQTDSMDYNKALKQFQHNLLKSDSDSSVLNEIVKKRKTRAIHIKKGNNLKNNRNKHKKREAPSTVSKKSNYEEYENIMKSRKQEVEEKLKNYSKKRTQSLNKKKQLEKSERIKQIAHQKLKHGDDIKTSKNECTDEMSKNVCHNKMSQNKFTIPTPKNEFLPETISKTVPIYRKEHSSVEINSEDQVQKSEFCEKVLTDISSNFPFSKDELKSHKDNDVSEESKHTVETIFNKNISNGQHDILNSTDRTECIKKVRTSVEGCFEDISSNFLFSKEELKSHKDNDVSEEDKHTVETIFNKNISNGQHDILNSTDNTKCINKVRTCVEGCFEATFKRRSSSSSTNYYSFTQHKTKPRVKSNLTTRKQIIVKSSPSSSENENDKPPELDEQRLRELLQARRNQILKLKERTTRKVSKIKKGNNI